VTIAAFIIAVGIVGDGPNSAVVVVDVADPQVGYTPCGTGGAPLELPQWPLSSSLGQWLHFPTRYTTS
jgi:hypothetical protein